MGDAIEKPDTAAWVGWAWQRGRWARVCQAGTLAECSTLLERHRGRTPAHLTLCKCGYAPPTWIPKTGNNAK